MKGDFFMSTQKTNIKQRIRFITVTGILGAVSTVLMMLSFSIPFMPSFIKFDFSELPALIAAFSMGPVSGVAVCLIKNLINLTMTTTGGVGELSNFILGASFVLPAGLIYKYHKTRKTALLSALLGSFVMGVISLPNNYFLTYPIYSKFMPIETIVGMYQKIFPAVADVFPGMDPLFSCLLIFNVPYTFFKGLVITMITFLIYKHISPIIKGNKTKK